MTFDIVKSGYNRYQVDDQMNELNAQLVLLTRQVSAYEKQGEEDRKKIQVLQEKLDQLQRDILIKERAASEMTQLALKEANKIINNATSNADLIVREALLSAKDILLNMNRLGVEAQEMKQHLNEQVRVLSETIEGFDLPPIPKKELLDKCEE